MPIDFRGALVGELSADGGIDIGLLERVATLISDYVLISWDTGGEHWEPLIAESVPRSRDRG